MQDFMNEVKSPLFDGINPVDRKANRNIELANCNNKLQFAYHFIPYSQSVFFVFFVL